MRNLLQLLRLILESKGKLRVILRSLGFIQIIKDPSANGNIPQIKAYYNFLNNQNYFLKAGARASNKGDSDGNSCIGCNFQCVVAQPSGAKHAITITQAYGISHARLTLPHVVYGLGKITNYVENFHLGIAKNKGSWYKSWTPVIPNSQLNIYTYGDSSEEWQIEVLVNPTNALLLIIICTVILALVVIFFIIIMDILERMKDRQKKDPFKRINLLKKLV